MEWITRAANERNAQRHRQETIARGAPTLWENVCRAIEQAVSYYRTFDDQPVEFSGCANHTIWVAVFQVEPVRQVRGPERDRVTITFHDGLIVARRNEVVKTFPISLNPAGHVCLMDGDKEISPEKFTELVLRELFFPG